MRINFDRPTNSLIIVSSLKDYQSLRRVIERLDSPRKQVFVEAMILEVTLDKQRDLGASFHGAKPFRHPRARATRAWSSAASTRPRRCSRRARWPRPCWPACSGPVLTPDEAREPRRRGRPRPLDIPSFGVLIKALQTNSDVDVLSNPHLLIMNNEDGEISVGSRVPFPVSTLGLGGGGAPAAPAPSRASRASAASSRNVQREKVALEMKLTPHVNEHDMIRLEVDEKISELAPGAEQPRARRRRSAPRRRSSSPRISRPSSSAA